MKPNDNSQRPEYFERDEVNLTPMFKFVSNQFNKLSDRVSYYKWLITKNIVTIASFVLLGVGASFFHYYLVTPTFKTTAIIVSNLLTNEYCSSLINTLGELAREKNYEQLAEKLNLKVETATKIKGIRYLNYSAAKQSRDTVIGQPFSVEVVVVDNGMLDSLQYSLVYYLENNVYALKRKTAKQAVLNDFSIKMDEELNELDSIMKKIHYGVIIKKDDEELQLYNPIDLYKKYLQIYEEKYQMMEKMALLSNFELIEGFTKFTKPSSPRLIKDAIYAGFIMFLIGFYLVLRADKKKRNWYKIRNWDDYQTNSAKSEKLVDQTEQGLTKP